MIQLGNFNEFQPSILGPVPQAALGRGRAVRQSGVQNQTGQDRGRVPEGGHRQLPDAGESRAAEQLAQVGKVQTGAGQNGRRVHARVLLTAQESEGKHIS